MRRLHILPTVFLAVFILGIANSQESSDDVKLIQGTWEVTEFLMSGMPAPEEARKEIRIVFTHETMSMKGPMFGGGKKEFRFKIDSSQKPRAIDMIAISGPKEGKTSPAIYELKDDTLRLCMSNVDTNDRPTEFKSTQDGHLGLIILKRTKP